MIVIAGLLGGATLGAVRARRRGGNRLDMAQYAAAYGIGLGLIGLIVTLVLTRAF